MNRYIFSDAFGKIEDGYISEAVYPERKRQMKFFWPLVAACLVLFAGVGIFALKPGILFPAKSSETAAEVLYEDINIYYLKDGEKTSETRYLRCSPEEIFNAWKELNGIGEEVKFISSRLTSNGTEKITEDTATYTVGDRFTYTLTISENIKNYYTSPYDGLLDSLEKTMREYAGYPELEYILELK